MVVESHLDPNIEICQNTLRGAGANIRAGGIIPNQITLMSPFPHNYGRNGPNYSTIVMFRPMANTSNTYAESQPKYTWVGVGLDRGVTTRSQNGQIA